MSTMMIETSRVKKMKTFFNKFIPQTRRDKTSLSISVKKDKVIHSCIFDELRVSTIVPFNGFDDYEPVVINYDHWYKRTDDKKDTEVQYMPVIFKNNYQLSIGKTHLIGATENEQEYNWNEIASNIEPKAMASTIMIANATTQNGKLAVNSNVYFRLKENTLKMINTNDVVLNECTIPDIDIEQEKCFSINNSYFGKMKSFFAYFVNVPEVNISVSENMIRFSTSIKEFEAELVCPMESIDETEKIYTALSHIINNKWYGKPVKLNEDTMIKDGVTDQITNMLQKKTKLSNKELLKELEKFNANESVQEAFKNLDKSIEVPFLSVASAVGKENLYVLRTMYQNYANAINEYPYSVYYLNTNIEALMFGHQTDEFKFKSLFMLRKPENPVVELSDEELEELSNVEDETIIMDDDTFVPT